MVKHRCSIKAPPKKTLTNSVPKDRMKTGVITSSFPPGRASLKAQLVKNPPAMQKTQARFLSREDLLEKGKATPSYPGQYFWASLVAQLVKNLPSMRETWVRSLGWEDPLEKGKASHFSILDPHSRPGEFQGVHGVAKSRTRLSDFRSTSQLWLLILQKPLLKRPPGLGQTAYPRSHYSHQSPVSQTLDRPHPPPKKNNPEADGP